MQLAEDEGHHEIIAALRAAGAFEEEPEEDDDDDRRIKRIEKTAQPSERDLAFLYRWNAVASSRGGASCGSGAQRKAVDDAVKRAVESAEKMYPFVTGCADYCPDIAVPANIEERYGGES